MVDQHTNELTFTQLSRSAIENSAPAQDRLRFLHSIVYPPRWELKKDLAERYSALGILVSASQIYEQLELWDRAPMSDSSHAAWRIVSCSAAHSANSVPIIGQRVP